MFNLKDVGDLGKIAGQAKELQRQQDEKHREQMGVLKDIAATLDQILAELRKK
jgi:hypothetical protein